MANMVAATEANPIFPLAQPQSETFIVAIPRCCKTGPHTARPSESPLVPCDFDFCNHKPRRSHCDTCVVCDTCVWFHHLWARFWEARHHALCRVLCLWGHCAAALVKTCSGNCESKTTVKSEIEKCIEKIWTQSKISPLGRAEPRGDTHNHQHTVIINPCIDKKTTHKEQ